MSADARTFAAYSTHARAYGHRFAGFRPDRHLRTFVDLLPEGADVLDLGCGPGPASARLRAAGMRPDAVDASPAMVAMANEAHDIGARVSTFDDLDAVAAYDGVWANFSLLHARREALPRHLSQIHKALKPGGLLHVGMKTGTGDLRDRLGRYYTLVTRDEITALLESGGFRILATHEGRERGLAGTLDPYIILRTRAAWPRHPTS